MKNVKNFKPETLQAQLCAAIEKRVQNTSSLEGKDHLNAELAFFKQERFVKVIEAVKGADFDLSFLLHVVGNSGDDLKEKKVGKEDFLAQKALTKVRGMFEAVAAGSVKMLDKYSFSVMKNLIELQQIDILNCQRSLCRKIEVDELAVTQAVKVYHNCSPNTASSQTGSTREMLRVLRVANVTKGKKGDAISFNESPAAQHVVKLFA